MNVFSQRLSQNISELHLSINMEDVHGSPIAKLVYIMQLYIPVQLSRSRTFVEEDFGCLIVFPQLRRSRLRGKHLLKMSPNNHSPVRCFVKRNRLGVRGTIRYLSLFSRLGVNGSATHHKSVSSLTMSTRFLSKASIYKNAKL